MQLAETRACYCSEKLLVVVYGIYVSPQSQGLQVRHVQMMPRHDLLLASSVCQGSC